MLNIICLNDYIVVVKLMIHMINMILLSHFLIFLIILLLTIVFVYIARVAKILLDIGAQAKPRIEGDATLSLR